MLFSCKKKSTPAAPASDNAASNLNSQEQSLLGYWYLDSILTLNNNVWQGTSFYSGNAMSLQNTKYTPGCLPSDSSYLCVTSYNSAWSAKKTGEFKLSAASTIGCVFTYTILTLTPSAFVREGDGFMPGETFRAYYHK